MKASEISCRTCILPSRIQLFPLFRPRIVKDPEDSALLRCALRAYSSCQDRFSALAGFRQLQSAAPEELVFGSAWLEAKPLDSRF